MEVILPLPCALCDSIRHDIFRTLTHVRWNKLTSPSRLTHLAKPTNSHANEWLTPMTIPPENTKCDFCFHTKNWWAIKFISLFFGTTHFDLQVRRCVTFKVLLFIARLLHFKVERKEINDFFFVLHAWCWTVTVEINFKSSVWTNRMHYSRPISFSN